MSQLKIVMLLLSVDTNSSPWVYQILYPLSEFLFDKTTLPTLTLIEISNYIVAVVVIISLFFCLLKNIILLLIK